MMSEIEENAENKPEGSPTPSSDQSVPEDVEDVNEGEPGADSPASKSSGPRTPPAPVSGSDPKVASDEPVHEAGVNGQEPPQGSPPAAEVGNSKDSLEEFDWDDLEQRFCAAMEKFQKMEDEIGEEYRQWLEVFEAWAAVTSIHEPDRAHKRLRTRMAWVQGAEKDLEEKRLHYVNVVKAFESALALLGGI